MTLTQLRTALLATTLAATLAAPALWAEKAPQKVLDLANTTLKALGSDPAIVAAVKAQNSQGLTLAKIQEQDAAWQKNPGIDPFMQGLLSNACSKRLGTLQKSEPYLAELFAVDNQGANVCLTDKTSDYWQGDEPKFKESWDGAAGKVFVADVKFDQSSQVYSTQVSVPVVEKGKAIGVLVIGIDVEKVK
jgi:hypothetical protein